MRKTLLLLAIVITSITSRALASTQTDYDHAVDFTQYHTYMWGQVKSKDSLWADRIHQDVDQQLKTKGWILVAADADVIVAALGDSHNEQEEQTFYSGMGGWRWGGVGGVATTSTYTTREGIFILSMFDAKTKKLAWKGTATGSLSDKPDKNVGKLNKAVAKMFDKFPPKR